MDSSSDESQTSTPREVPSHARVEDIEGYSPGGFHPIHLGDQLGSDERFEVHHKLGYSEKCTVWLCLDRKNERHVGIKVFQAKKSLESHPEIAALRLFEDVSYQELRAHHILPIEEHFWLDGPNGRHLCFVVQVLGPSISYSLPGMDLDTPDLLTDLCLRAALILQFLHEKSICHGDFRPDHLRMELDSDRMSGRSIYKLFGEPKIWYLKDHLEEKIEGRPQYLVEPAGVARLEAEYRTGDIYLDSLASSYRKDDAHEPQLVDNHHVAPEVRFLGKPSGFSSDIWSLASTIHLIRTSKVLSAGLESRSGLVTWLAWAHGPFPRDNWKSIGEYLSHDSAIPVFTVNPIPQRPPIVSQRESMKQKAGKRISYPREWGGHRQGVASMLLGSDETPWSIRERKLLQKEKDRSKYLRIKLPRDLDTWAKFQGQRKRLTGFQSLLHEDLSKERQWYQDTDALNGHRNDSYRRQPDRIEEVALQRLNGPWRSGFDLDRVKEGGHSHNQETKMDARVDCASSSTNTNGKRSREEDHEALRNRKRPKLFATEHSLRDLVERVEQHDGMTKFAYRLQPEEVNLLAGLLLSMLENDPAKRIGIDEVLRHEWFAKSRERLKGLQ